MLRGFLSGTILGGVVAGGVLVVASRILDVMDLALPEPNAGAVAVPAGSEFNRERPDSRPVIPQTEGRPGANETPLVSQPVAGDAPVTDTTPVGTPETGIAEGELDTPQAGANPEVAVGGTDSVQSVPGAEQPPQPGVDATPNAPAPLETPQVRAVDETDLDAPGSEAAPSVDGAGGDIAVAAAPEVEAPSQPLVDTSPSADSPAAAPDTDSGPAVIDSPTLEADSPTNALPDAPQGLVLDAPEIGQVVPGVTTDRLPRIGAEPETPNDVVLEPAIVRHSTPFENADGSPLMGLVLIDDASFDLATLVDFPVPLTIALDPNSDGVGARMAALRRAGVELAVLTPLPEGATPADVEVAFQSYLAAVPQAVAVMDLPEVVLQVNRPRAAQVAQILAETGHGMITYEKGLNAGLQMADTAGVPAAAVFRVFDDGTRDGTAMKRFLDQGAFRAGQVGPVLLIGQAREEKSLAAIAEWALGTRAATVALAPTSAVLSAK